MLHIVEIHLQRKQKQTKTNNFMWFNIIAADILATPGGPFSNMG